MKRSSYTARLYMAGVALLLCSGLAWAATVHTTATRQQSNVESKFVLMASDGSVLAPPVVPEWATYGEDYVADGTTAYFLYNVGCGQFVTGANAWATQISLGTDGLPYMQLVVEPMSATEETVYPGAVKLKINGRYTFYGYNDGRENGFTLANTYLFRDTQTSGFIDRNQQPVWYWNFEKNTNGTYAWHSAYGMGTYDATNQYASCEEAGAPVVFNATKDNNNNEWLFIPYVAYQLYKARVALYDKLLEAVENGVNTDYATSVYNNDDATLEELQETYNALVSELTNLAVLPLIEESSEDHPIDITQFAIVNPDFEEGQEPWTITEGMGQNLQVQGTPYTNGDVIIRNFIESWIPSPNSLRNGVICQTVYGLPEGRYRIEADVIAVRQEIGFPKEEQEGIYLFYNNGEYTIHSGSLSTGNGIPEHFIFDFDYAGAEQMTIGLMAESTNCNWMGMDNFRLYALGQMQNDPLRQALEEAIAGVDEIESNIVDNDIYDFSGNTLNASVKAKDDFLNALAAARRALESGSGYQNAIDALTAATDAFRASVAVYDELQLIWQDATEKQDWLVAKGQWSALAEQITNFANNIFAGFKEGILDAAALPNARTAVQNMISQYLATQGNLQPGDDLTLLIKNADFSKGSGLDLTGDDVPGWNIVSGSITELSAAYHNIEAYHRTFDFQQTVVNLPAGTYRITVQGFVRIDGGNNSMVLYAGVSERNFKLETEENSEVQICTDGTGSTAWPYDLVNPVLGGYMPNSMQGSMMYFESINPVTEKPYYLNDVTIAHIGGDLTIGVKCDDLGLWIIWDNFALEYVGEDTITPIFEEIDDLAERLTAMLDEYTIVPDELTEAYTAIMARVASKEYIRTLDEAIALRDDVKAVVHQATREPYVRISVADDIETLTFYYGHRTPDAYEVALSYGNVSERTWHSDAEAIQRVVFDPSFVDYRPTSTFGWFYGMANLTDIEGLENLNTSDVTDMKSMFLGCSSLTSLDLGSFDTGNVTQMNYMFYECNALASLDLSSFNTSKVTNMNCMFENCPNLTNLDLSSFDTSNVTSMSWMFYGCSSLASLDLSNFDTSNVTDMRYMFYGCSGLTSLDLSSFDTSNVISMCNMFYMCSGLTSLDVSNFNTSNVTDMYLMFGDCSSLTSLDLSSFDTDIVTDMRYMFSYCSSLTTIFVAEGWNTDVAADINGGYDMFYACENLVGGKGTAYNEDYTDLTYAHIDGGAADPGYLSIEGEVATGIAGMENGNESGAVYDLSGRRVGTSTSDIQRSRKGLYVTNGKKVVVK